MPHRNPTPPHARLIAGIPVTNRALYHRIRFQVGDPTAYIELLDDQGAVTHTILLLRDIEMERARAATTVDAVASPSDFAPESGLSGDRETATAQAVAECLRQHDVRIVDADRTLPLSFAHEIEHAGIQLRYDPDLGVAERRSKDAREIQWLRDAQATTEQAIRMACTRIAHAAAHADGVLHEGSQPLTAEIIRTAIDVFLLERGYANPACIVAGGPQGADCHHRGTGPLRTGEPIIIDVFPQNQNTLYNGDCTRVVVHGNVPDEIAAMHQAVVDAKQAAIQAIRAGVSGESVHDAATQVLTDKGYELGLPTQPQNPPVASMVHGTGHGIGLEVHEPPLLDRNGPPLVAGDALTVEPGLYKPGLGGIRIEDMVIVTEHGCDNLNTLPEDLDWS